MNTICALIDLVSFVRPKKGIANLKAIGFENVLLDISRCCSVGELEDFGVKRKNQKFEMGQKDKIKISEHPEELHKYLKLLLEECEKEHICILVTRAPYQARNTKRKDLGKLLTQLAEESIMVCRKAGCQYLIIKPLFAGLAHKEKWEVNRNFYLGLADIARKNHVIILLENQCSHINGHLVGGICADANEAATWVDQLNKAAGEERFGFCMDVGTCNLCGQNMYEFAVTLGNRIKAVILRECDGHHDESMLPFTCVNNNRSTTDWLGLIRGLREIDFDGQLIMDFSSTTATFSPLLRPHLLPLAKNIADYFKWQISMKTVLKRYNTRVLFGAGNMCRNYMKCYGEEFPPLFTCDNNKSRWGEQFEGLEIKPPETLKELPSDCAVFICNVYYKEIEEQLRKMGLSNPIEYFNDEYMPSFYFDTLEYWKGEQ